MPPHVPTNHDIRGGQNLHPQSAPSVPSAPVLYRQPAPTVQRGPPEAPRPECRLHLSSFDSVGTHFVSGGFDTGLFDYDDPSFDHRAAWAIPPGAEAEYQYDLGDTIRITVTVEPVPQRAQAWLAKYDIDAGDPVLRNLMPELCDDCGQEASHFRPGETLCIGCLPENPPTYVELLASTPRPAGNAAGKPTATAGRTPPARIAAKKTATTTVHWSTRPETAPTASTSAPSPSSACSRRTTLKSDTPPVPG